MFDRWPAGTRTDTFIIVVMIFTMTTCNSLLMLLVEMYYCRSDH